MNTNKTIQHTAVTVQALVIATLWLALAVYLCINPTIWDPNISVASFVAIPAMVIGVTQLLISTNIQRASYIKDYAIRFRTDKELSESFHYLIYRYSNHLFEIHSKSANIRTTNEERELDDAQAGLTNDLTFFDPKQAIGSPQERIIDNLLGFFDTVGYDLRRKLLFIADVSGVFSYHLDHLIQRKVVQAYLKNIEEKWPTLETFHERYNAPVPFKNLRYLLRKYEEHRKSENQRTAKHEG
jgi:hypothetical protein